MTLVATLCALSTPVSAQNHIKAALVAESSEPAPGKAFTIAILMQPEQGWHGYWQNPGDAGLSAQLRWTLPNGATVSAPRYPVPERLVIADLMNHVYNAEHALLATLTIPPHLAKGTRLPLRMSIDRLACTDKICVPNMTTSHLTSPSATSAIAAANRARFDAWRMKVPRPLGSITHFQIEGPAIRIGIPFFRQPPGDRSLVLFHERKCPELCRTPEGQPCWRHAGDRNLKGELWLCRPEDA